MNSCCNCLISSVYILITNSQIGLNCCTTVSLFLILSSNNFVRQRMSEEDSAKRNDDNFYRDSTDESPSFSSTENKSTAHQFSAKRITILKRPTSELNEASNIGSSNQLNSEQSVGIENSAKSAIVCSGTTPSKPSAIKLEKSVLDTNPAIDCCEAPSVDAGNEENPPSKSSDGKGSEKSESGERNVNDMPKRKLPDLPADLGPLKARCTSMSQEVLQLLSQKIKEDLVKTKEAKDMARTQQLRELSWKVTDMLALGSSAVKEFETKSAYQLQRDREMKKYKNKKNRQWNSQSSNNIHNDQGGNQWRQNRQRGHRARGGRRNYNDRSNCDSSHNWRSHGFNFRAAKQFAKSFVRQVINRAQEQILVEEERRARDQMERKISVAKEVVDSVLGKAIQILVAESNMKQNNLSLTEAELLRDMCEESISDEESFLIDVEDTISIKKEPRMGC